jgi:glycine/D-amino acid oxidase-like deaminating enzyme
VDLAWRAAGVYVAGRTRLWLGGSVERAGFDRSPSRAARTTILGGVARMLPGLRRARVLRQTAALRPSTPDTRPIVGIPDGWENACLAVGGGRKGMLLSAALGRAAAELLTAGATALPVGSCSPQRWIARPLPEVARA